MSIEKSNEPMSEMNDEETLDLAKQRDAELESGEVVPLSHEELMQRLRNGRSRR